MWEEITNVDREGDLTKETEPGSPGWWGGGVPGRDGGL